MVELGIKPTIASGLFVRDVHGNTKLELGEFASGDDGLNINGNDSKRGLTLTVKGSGASALALCNANVGKTQAVLTVDETKSSYLEFYEPTELLCAQFGQFDDGKTTLSLHDRDKINKARHVMAILPDGRAATTITGKTKPGIQLLAYNDDVFDIRISDGTSYLPRISLGVTANDWAGLSVRSTGRKQTLYLGGLADDPLDLRYETTRTPFDAVTVNDRFKASRSLAGLHRSLNGNRGHNGPR